MNMPERIDELRRRGLTVSDDGFMPTPDGPVHIDDSTMRRKTLAAGGGMIRYTLNTGRSRVAQPDEVNPDALEAIYQRGWLKPGKHRFPRPIDNYHIVVPKCEHGFAFTVYKGYDIPIAMSGVADTEESADEVWPALERPYLWLTEKPPVTRMDWEAPHKPDSVPWLATVLLGLPLEIMRADWLGELNIALAWAWIGRAGAGFDNYIEVTFLPPGGSWLPGNPRRVACWWARISAVRRRRRDKVFH